MRPGQVAATVWDTKNLQEALGEASAEYGRLQLPTVILAGDHDRGIENSRRLARELPSAELRVLGGAGHELPLTHPDALVEAVQAVLTRAARRGVAHGAPSRRG
jgi:pimeloyl-ACP methyl ester carboxylesterase